MLHASNRFPACPGAVSAVNRPKKERVSCEKIRKNVNFRYLLSCDKIPRAIRSLAVTAAHLPIDPRLARMVLAADGVSVVDFGMRRMHGLESAWRGVRAYRVAGIAGTSNVLGGLSFDLPVRGTMAHSYIQSHDDETEALRKTLAEDTVEEVRSAVEQCM